MGDTTYVPLITVQDLPTLAGDEASSSAQVFYGHGAPVSTPTGAAIYTDRDTGTIYTWTGSTWA